jgi:hypothetical protein
MSVHHYNYLKKYQSNIFGKIWIQYVLKWYNISSSMKVEKKRRKKKIRQLI